MSDLIDRDAAIALPPYDGDGDPAGQFDHHIFVKLSALRALPAVEVGVKPGEIERAVWSAMMWAADNNPSFDGVPEYTDRGNSFAEDEARRAAARIRSALTVTPARKEVMPDDAAEIDGLPKSFDTSPGVTAGAVTPAPDAGKVQALVEALEKINVGEGWAAKIARAALAAMKEG